MKTNSFFKTIALIAIISLASCSKNDNKTTDTSLTSADAQASSKMDKASNDVGDIAEDQFLLLPGANKTATYSTILPSCATSVLTLNQGVSWSRLVTFTNCTFNGNTLNGQIRVSGSLPLPDSSTMATTGYTINYEFINFTHNSITLSGNRSITRKFTTSSLLNENHPIHIMDVNMTATFPTGTYTRVGTRTRECVANYGDGILSNNVYKVYQSIETTRPNGAVHTHVVSVNSPLTIDLACQYKIVSGVLTITGPNHTASIDYGTGTCDNNATISIDGGAATAFTFGN